MKVTIPAGTKLNLNGLTGTAASDFDLETEITSPDALAETCFAAGLSVANLGYTDEDGNEVSFGANCKKIVTPKKVKAKVEDEPKPEAPKKGKK